VRLYYSKTGSNESTLILQHVQALLRVLNHIHSTPDCIPRAHVPRSHHCWGTRSSRARKEARILRVQVSPHTLTLRSNVACDLIYLTSRGFYPTNTPHGTHKSQLLTAPQSRTSPLLRIGPRTPDSVGSRWEMYIMVPYSISSPSS
jgi:hypothetical protein